MHFWLPHAFEMVFGSRKNTLNYSDREMTQYFGATELSNTHC